MDNQQTTITRVKVDDLVIDMALDADNVEEKKVSMSASGMIQPLMLWQEGHRIIDGFHRVAAAKLLGWEYVDAVVRDIPEEAFWDARIQSARQHAEVSDERLAQWVVSCWTASEWPTKLDLSRLRQKDRRDFSVDKRFHRKQTRQLTQDHKQIAEALWLLRTNKIQDGDRQRLEDWFAEKAVKWSMSLADLERIIYGIVAIPQPNKEFETVVAEKGMTFDQRNDLALDAIQPRAGESPAHFGTKRAVASTATNYLREANPGETLRQYEAREREQESARRQVDEGKRVLNLIDGHVRGLERMVNNHFQVLRDLGPTGAAALLNGSNTLIDLAEKVYPGAKDGKWYDAIAADNERLQNELKEARLKITQLEQQLRRTTGIFSAAESVFAVHSTEISKKPQ